MDNINAEDTSQLPNVPPSLQRITPDQYALLDRVQHVAFRDPSPTVFTPPAPRQSRLDRQRRAQAGRSGGVFRYSPSLDSPYQYRRFDQDHEPVAFNPGLPFAYEYTPRTPERDDSSLYDSQGFLRSGSNESRSSKRGSPSAQEDQGSTPAVKSYGGRIGGCFRGHSNAENAQSSEWNDDAGEVTLSATSDSPIKKHLRPARLVQGNHQESFEAAHFLGAPSAPTAYARGDKGEPKSAEHEDKERTDADETFFHGKAIDSKRESVIGKRLKDTDAMDVDIEVPPEKVEVAGVDTRTHYEVLDLPVYTKSARLIELRAQRLMSTADPGLAYKTSERVGRDAKEFARIELARAELADAEKRAAHDIAIAQGNWRGVAIS